VGLLERTQQAGFKPGMHGQPGAHFPRASPPFWGPKQVVRKHRTVGDGAEVVPAAPSGGPAMRCSHAAGVVAPANPAVPAGAAMS
jgi:hypothetical protein